MLYNYVHVAFHLHIQYALLLAVNVHINEINDQIVVLVSPLYRSIVRFSDLIRELASSLPTCQNMIPADGLVFDYYLDLKSYCFTPWTERKQEKTNITNKKYVSVPEVSL